MTLGTTLSWFGIYLFIGGITLIILRTTAILVEMKDKQVSTWVSEVYQLLHEPFDKRSFWKRHRETFIIFPWIWLFWPIAIAIAIKVIFFPSEWKPDPEAAFTCRRQHLVLEVTPEAAEHEAAIFDPLGRVPDLPFGHLNAGWRALLASRQKMDRLWYFELPGDAKHEGGNPWPVPQGARRGYALVSKGKVRAEFVFEWD